MSDANPRVTVKNGREFPVLAGHPWIFSNGVLRSDPCPPGGLVDVYSGSGTFLGTGTWHPGNTIRVRMLSRLRERPDAAFFARRFAGLLAEKTPFLPPDTDGFRLVHGDADRLPGLVVDMYAGTAVFQISTAGMEPFRSAIVDALRDPEGAVRAKAVAERSDTESRRQENLPPEPPAVHHGKVEDLVPFRERGLTMLADVLRGQKTGFFLDQREAREAAGRLARGRRAVNLFSYTCAFGLSAMAGGAESVLNVDSSGPALETGRRIFAAGGFGGNPACEFPEADVFDFLEAEKAALRRRLDGGLLVCDPPAFAKSASRLDAAKKAYSRLARLCFEVLGPGGILITSSCSGALSAEDFLDIVRVAAGWAGRRARVLGFLGQPADHTTLLPFPEGRYLKTYILEVRSDEA